MSSLLRRRGLTLALTVACTLSARAGLGVGRRRRRRRRCPKAAGRARRERPGARERHEELIAFSKAPLTIDCAINPSGFLPPFRGKHMAPRSSLPEVLRIAHVSDLHVLSPHGVEWRRILFNKRVTGYVNLIRQRGRVYRREYLATVLSAAAAQADQLVVTGDITNLSLEREFDEARALLDGVARKVEVTVVPGNHDAYLPSIHVERRFLHHFAPFLRSDLPGLARDLTDGSFPCVKLRGPAAIIALSSAVPRPPFVASGRVGEAQLAALEEILAHPEVARRTPVVLIHHPPVDGRIRPRQLRDGLVDAERLRRVLSRLARGLVLFGHLHVRVRHRLQTAVGALDVIGASGAALDHPSPVVRAGFNSYVIGDDGSVASAEAHVVAPDGGTLERMPLSESPELA